MVEHSTVNPMVIGSIPILNAVFFVLCFKYIILYFLKIVNLSGSD